MITGKELVIKLYSEIEEDNLLQEIYEKAFSEGYEYAQREFARKDYEGLDPILKYIKRRKRARLAKTLNEERKGFNSKLNEYKAEREKEDLDAFKLRGKGYDAILSTIKSLKDKKKSGNLKKEDIDKALSQVKNLRESIKSTYNTRLKYNKTAEKSKRELNQSYLADKFRRSKAIIDEDIKDLGLAEKNISKSLLVGGVGAGIYIGGKKVYKNIKEDDSIKK